MRKQTTIVVIGSLRVKDNQMFYINVFQRVSTKRATHSLYAENGKGNGSSENGE